MNKDERLKLYKSILSRDPRNDGRFFVGVKTTGIYCRPICPARPKLENVEFFKSKAEAETAGFRPCLRCKPDLSPLSPQWRGTAAVMGRALHLIEIGEENIADKLGMTDRHLRRLFKEHIGASPIEVAISRRLHLSRQLLSQTSLTITDIAFASGFNSLRRFNDAFQKTYHKPPSAYRKELSQETPLSKALLTLELPYTPPYDWDWMLNFFERHATLGVEHVSEGKYLRQFRTTNGTGFYQLSLLKKENRIKVELQVEQVADIRFVIEQIRSQFDLAHNPFHIESPKLKKELKSVRIPGAFDPFEVAISIILGQVVSTEQARKNIHKITVRYGEPLHRYHAELTHLFPTPEILAKADFSEMGFTTSRCEAIRELSRLVALGEIDLSKTSDQEVTKRKLSAIKGIGDWTTELILMRCLADTDAFPRNDLILKRSLEKSSLDVSKLSPWRSYLALAIWKNEAHLLSKKKRKT